MDPETNKEYEHEVLEGETPVEETIEETQVESTSGNEGIPEGGIPVQYKSIVVYDHRDIVDVLQILNEKTPIVGIDAMRNIVKVFDILNNGNPQQAYVNANNNQIIDASAFQMMTPIQQEPVVDYHPELISEGEPIETEPENIAEEANE